MCTKLRLSPPTDLSIEMPLSLSTTSMLDFVTATLFKASKASPPVIEPSPMTAMCCRWVLP